MGAASTTVGIDLDASFLPAENNVYSPGKQKLNFHLDVAKEDQSIKNRNPHTKETGSLAPPFSKAET